jgi:predicted PurR-regulated permease PerM
MLSRILAVILLLVGIVGIVVAIAGAVVSYQAVDSVVDAVDSLGTAFEQTLEFASDGLDTVSDTQVGTTLQGRVDEINDTVAQTQVNVNNQLRTVRLGLLLIFLWFGLTQLLPLYIGADLLADGRLGSKLLSK